LDIGSVKSVNGEFIVIGPTKFFQTKIFGDKSTDQINDSNLPQKIIGTKVTFSKQKKIRARITDIIGSVSDPYLVSKVEGKKPNKNVEKKILGDTASKV